MFDIIYTIFLVILLLVAAASIIIRRKIHNIRGVKPFLSSGCFFIIALLNLLSGWFDFYGMTTWGATLLLILLAAYFTKYLSDAKSYSK
ncbi:hypothetical protein CN918_28470 [Priestia megaterium]|nr:hypothetical protein CN918_28470 [Priestia megaterium]